MPDDPSSLLSPIRAEALGSIAYAGDHACPDINASCSAHHALRLLAAVEAALKLHQPKPLYGLAFGGLNYDKPVCGHDPDSDHDAHFEGDDGLWYCRDKITGQACITCAEEDAADLWAEWPCPTYAAISTALAGEEAGDGK